MIELDALIGHLQRMQQKAYAWGHDYPAHHHDDMEDALSLTTLLRKNLVSDGLIDDWARPFGTGQMTSEERAVFIADNAKEKMRKKEEARSVAFVTWAMMRSIND